MAKANKSENWIKWDLDSRLGWRMAGFVAEYGAIGYGIFVMLVEMLYRADDHKLSFDTNAYKLYTNLFKVEQNVLERTIESLVSAGLIQRDENYLWSNRVIQEIAERSSKSELLSQKRQDAVNTRWNKEKVKKNDTKIDTKSYKPIQTDTNDTRLDKIRLDKNILIDKSINSGNVKKNTKYKNFNTKDFELPIKWGEKATQALAEWVEYKTASGTPKLLASYQAEVALYGDNPQLFTQLVTRAKIRGWKGLNEDIPLEQSNSSFSNKKPFESKHEENVRLGMETLKRFAEMED